MAVETRIVYVAGMPVEQQELDAEGTAAREQLNGLAYQTYEKEGTISTLQVREETAAFETFSAQHVAVPAATDDGSTE